MDTKIYTDEQKLSIMYEGDKARDATDKIRGFLFQDLITIMCLLQKNVKYVCSEYIEDVDVFFEDNTFEFSEVLSKNKPIYERNFNGSLLSIS